MRHPQTLDRRQRARTRDHLAHRVLLTGHHHRPRPVHRRDRHPIGAPASNGATSSSEASTATIAPPAGNACINRPRATTRRSRIRQATTPPPHTPQPTHRPNAPPRNPAAHPTTPPTGTTPPQPRTTPPARTPSDPATEPLGPVTPRTPPHATNSPNSSSSRRTHLIERLREHRERLIQLPAHPHPLRTLTETGTPSGHSPTAEPSPRRRGQLRPSRRAVLLESRPTTTARCSSTARPRRQREAHIPGDTSGDEATCSTQARRLRRAQPPPTGADSTHGTTDAPPGTAASCRLDLLVTAPAPAPGSRGRWCR